MERTLRVVQQACDSLRRLSAGPLDEKYKNMV